MAVLRRGILGGFRGKVANVVGAAWKGIDTMRSLPVSVANPNTPAQQQQRTRFAEAVRTAQSILTYAIKPLWDRFVSQQSGFNAFIQANIEWFDQNGLNNEDQFAISQGSYTNVNVTSVTADSQVPTIQVDFDQNGGNADDEVYLVCWDNDEQLWGHAPQVYQRDAGSVSFEPQGFDLIAGDTLFVFAAVRRNDQRAVSGTTFGDTTIN